MFDKFELDSFYFDPVHNDGPPWHSLVNAQQVASSCKWPWVKEVGFPEAVRDNENIIDMKWNVQITGSRNCTGTVIGSAFQHVLTDSACCPSTVDDVIVVSFGVSGSFPRSFQRRYIDDQLKLCLIRPKGLTT